jgi:hypothetical protein
MEGSKKEFSRILIKDNFIVGNNELKQQRRVIADALLG